MHSRFPADYPSQPPACFFEPALFHPNVYPSGKIEFSLVAPPLWQPKTTVKSILLGNTTSISTFAYSTRIGAPHCRCHCRWGSLANSPARVAHRSSPASLSFSLSLSPCPTRLCPSARGVRVPPVPLRPAGIQLLLAEPNPECPARAEAAALFM